jgi:hypothetical protein
LSDAIELEAAETDLQMARWRLDSVLRAPYEGRWTGDQIQHEDAVSAAQRRVKRLAAELAELRERVDS